MKPITYWVQNDAINQLVEQFGAHLERLSQYDRRTLIALLAEPHLWNVLELSNEAMEDVCQHLFKPLTRHEKDLLIEAIAATLTHQGSPCVENAIAQKEGTPTH